MSWRELTDLSKEQDDTEEPKHSFDNRRDSSECQGTLKTQIEYHEHQRQQNYKAVCNLRAVPHEILKECTQIKDWLLRFFSFT